MELRQRSGHSDKAALRLRRRGLTSRSNLSKARSSVAMPRPLVGAGAPAAAAGAKGTLKYADVAPAAGRK